MQLKSLEIKNFKGIDEHGIKIDFAPITMLFGPNNAGKSTIIQAFYLANEIFNSPMPQLENLKNQGKGARLGSFKDYVHKHDTNRSVIIRLDFDNVVLNNQRFIKSLGSLEHMHEIKRIIKDVKSMGIELSIARDTRQEKPILESYALYFNGHKFTELNREDNSAIVCSKRCYPEAFNKNQENNVHPFLQKFIKRGDSANNFELSFNASNSSFPQWGELAYMHYDGKGNNSLLGKNWYGDVATLYELDDNDDATLDACNTHFNEALHIDVLFSVLFLAPGKIAGDYLKNFISMGAVREIPSRGIYSSHDTFNRWANGGAVWDLLAEASKEELKIFNDKLETLGINYTLEVEKLLTLNADGELAEILRKSLHDEDVPVEKLALLREFLGQAHETKILLRNKINKVITEFSDMGLGISQVIPVIGATVFAAKNTLVAIEEPESHIHPKMQVALGDVFIEAALASKNTPTILIETHSEHLLLRLLKRIRHTNEGDVPENLRFTAQDISVNWIGSTSSTSMEYEAARHTYATRLELDEDGSFDTPWPEGYFDERGEELFG